MKYQSIQYEVHAKFNESNVFFQAHFGTVHEKIGQQLSGKEHFLLISRISLAIVPWVSHAHHQLNNKSCVVNSARPISILTRVWKDSKSFYTSTSFPMSALCVEKDFSTRITMKDT
jgi:hypothetical protein